MVRLLVLLLCISLSTTQKPANFNLKEKVDVDPQVLEIHRQNLITQKILQRYLERRLHPERKPQIRVPSVDEILARSLASSSVRGTRQQNQNATSLYKSTSGSRYNLFGEYSSKLYDEEQGDRNQGQNDEDYEGERELDPYDDLGSSLDNDHIDVESLQSGESEHVDSFYRDKSYRQRASQLSDCPNCVEDSSVPMRWTMPLLKLGEKRYYLSIFFKANWFKALQYCRYHGMQLASIQSQEENDRLEKYVKDYGLAAEHFWTSGTDLAEEGSFFWISNGRPLSFTNWNAGEPNNFRYENGEEEHCLELWNRDGKGLKWNDTPCSFETYFICEV
ncbi:collectin-10 [Topomyia yanbarensis]|uniref:collectin-10 n=1 Tax=Topomyia yanbarensis TaxID=2498891 RepID=UPI00273A81CC|nr:collectin-10 [Topomyia yanbarensis]